MNISDCIKITKKPPQKNKKQCVFTDINVDWLDCVDMNVGGWGGAVSLAKLITVVFLPWPETLWNGNGFGRGHGWMAQRPERNRHNVCANCDSVIMTVGKKKCKMETYPMESDGGIDGHTSDTGVVPSDDTSSWVIGWWTKNLDVNNKLEREETKPVRYPLQQLGTQ